MRKFIIVGFLGLLLLAALLSRPVQRFLAEDRCLDAGGRWDRDHETCER